MHYNIVLLYKKLLTALLSYSLWKVIHYVTVVLHFVNWAGLAYLFLIKKIKKNKVIFLATVKALSHQK